MKYAEGFKDLPLDSAERVTDCRAAFFTFFHATRIILVMRGGATGKAAWMAHTSLYGLVVRVVP